MAKGGCFSSGPGGKFPVSHLQGGGDPVLTRLLFVQPNVSSTPRSFWHIT
jgi:hypothetical protein